MDDDGGRGIVGVEKGPHYKDSLSRPPASRHDQWRLFHPWSGRSSNGRTRCYWMSSDRRMFHVDRHRWSDLGEVDFFKADFLEETQLEEMD